MEASNNASNKSWQDAISREHEFGSIQAKLIWLRIQVGTWHDARLRMRLVRGLKCSCGVWICIVGCSSLGSFRRIGSEDSRQQEVLRNQPAAPSMNQVEVLIPQGITNWILGAMLRRFKSEVRQIQVMLV